MSNLTRRDKNSSETKSPHLPAYGNLCNPMSEATGIRIAEALEEIMKAIYRIGDNA